MEINYKLHSIPNLENGEKIPYYDILGSHSHLGAIAGLQKNELRFDLLDPNEEFTYIDIGANCGVFGLYVASQFKYSNVKLFECNPLMLHAISKSLSINNLPNVTLYPFGLYDKNICQDMFLNFNNPGGCGLNKSDEDTSKFEGLFYDFETILNVYDNIKYLKIDIEGAEFNIFKKLIDSNSNFFEKVSILNLEFHNSIYPNLEKIVSRKEIENYLSSFSNLNVTYQS